MANIAQLGATAMLGISAYMFPSQIVRLRSLIMFVVGHILYHFVKSSKNPELLGQGKLKQILEECSTVLTDTYYPTPWCLGPHLHTVFRVLFQHVPKLRLEREYITTPDGGQFALDWLINKGPDDLDKPIVLVVPGITGGSHNNYVRHLMLNGHSNKCRTLVFNNRGCASSTLLTPRMYSGSNTEDLSLAVRTLTERYANAPIIIVAVSLGGMITTHYVTSSEASKSNVKAACIVSSPWNSFGTYESINKPVNHILYQRYLLAKLKTIVSNHKHLYQNKRLPFNYRHIMKAETLWEWDDRFTSKMFGFKDWKEYYSDGHSFKKLPYVEIPMLIINAEDDPLSPLDYLPFSEVQENPNLAMILTKTGGHIGFLEGWLPRGPTWLNRAVDDFIRLMIFTDFLKSSEDVPNDYY